MRDPDGDAALRSGHANRGAPKCPTCFPAQAARTRPGTLDAALGPEEIEPDVISSGDVRWLNMERPREADREWLEQEFGFHPLAIEDVASRNQRPKLDAYDDYLFIVLHFPVFDKSQDRLLTAEVDIFVGPDFLITLPDQNLPPLGAMFERYRARDEVRDNVFGKGTGYLLYKIVDTCVDASFPMLRRIGDKLDRLEDDIFEGRSAEIVRELSNAKQEIINFRRVVRPMRAVLRDLERTKQRYLTDELDVYFDDITDAAERIWDVLENYKEVAEALEDTNESVLSHRLNESLRLLTAFSVTLLPLTLLTGLFGMNVTLPGQPGSAVEFWLIVIVMATCRPGPLSSSAARLPVAWGATTRWRRRRTASPPPTSPRRSTARCWSRCCSRPSPGRTSPSPGWACTWCSASSRSGSPTSGRRSWACASKGRRRARSCSRRRARRARCWARRWRR